jgi:hypothetical protein
MKYVSNTIHNNELINQHKHFFGFNENCPQIILFMMHNPYYKLVTWVSMMALKRVLWYTITYAREE